MCDKSTGYPVFDKLIELINSSTKIGFALLFAAAAFFAGRYYHQWPFTLLQEQLGYVLFGGLLGAGVLTFQFLRLLKALFLLAYYACRVWFKNQNVMSRVGELTLEQQADLLWIAHHPNRLSKAPLEEPFRGLCKKRFLFL